MPRRWASPAIALLAGALVAGLTQMGSFTSASATSPACVNQSPGSAGIPEAPTITGITASETGLSIAFTFPGTSASPQYVRVILNGMASVASGTTSPVTVSGLSPATDYSVVICGGAPGGDGDPSNTVSTRTLGDPPARQATAPSAPNLDITTTTSSVTVTPVAGDDGGSGITAVDVTIDGQSFRGNPGQSFTKSGLVPARDYAVSATVQNSVGTSPIATQTARTKGGPPSAPGQPVLETASATRVSVTWQPATANGIAVMGYRVKVDGAVVCSFFGPGTRCEFSRPAQRRFSVSVDARAGWLFGPAATATIELPVTEPGALARAQATVSRWCRTAECRREAPKGTPASVTVTWEAAPRSLGGSDAATVTARLGSQSCTAPAGSGSCVITTTLDQWRAIARGAAADRRVQVAVRNEAGIGPALRVPLNGTATSDVTGSEMQDRAPDAPTGLVAIGEDRRLALVWDYPSEMPGSAPTEYRVTATCEGDCAGDPPAVTTTCSPFEPDQCVVSGLAGGVRYRVSVVAANATATSAPATASATTQGPPPAPAAPTAAWEGQSLIVRWQSVAGTGLTYRLEDDRGNVACAASTATQCAPTPGTYPTKYKVVAVNPDGTATSPLSSAYGIASLPQLTGITVTRLSADQSRISWTPATLPAGTPKATAVVTTRKSQGCLRFDPGLDRCVEPFFGPTLTVCSADMADGGCVGTFEYELDEKAQLTVKAPPGPDGPAATFQLQHLVTADPPARAWVSGFGNDNLTISWDAPARTQYLAGYVAKAATGQECRVGADARSCTISGLRPRQIAEIYVGSITSGGYARVANMPTPARAIPGPPGAPENVTMQALGADGVRVRWSPSAADADFAVAPTRTYEVLLDGSFGCQVETGRGTSCDIRGLQPGRSVAARVLAINGVGQSELSAPSQRVTIGLPAAPTSLTARQRDSLVTATWALSREGAQANRFRLEVDGRIACGGLAERTTCDIPNLAPGTHTLTVTAGNDVGVSPSLSTSIDVVGAPGVPRDFLATAVDSGVLLQWQAPDAPATNAPQRYVVTMMRGFFGDISTACNVDASETTCEVTGLKNGDPLGFAVSAENIAGSTYSPWELVTVGERDDAATGAPGGPTNIRAIYLPNSNSYRVTWDAPKDRGGSRVLTYQAVIFVRLGLEGGLQSSCQTRSLSCTIKMPLRGWPGMEVFIAAGAKNSRGYTPAETSLVTNLPRTERD